MSRRPIPSPIDCADVGRPILQRTNGTHVSLLRRFVNANTRFSARFDAPKDAALFWRYDQYVAEAIRMLRPGSTIVDVGGGRTCSFAEGLNDTGSVRVVAVDVSTTRAWRDFVTLAERNENLGPQTGYRGLSRPRTRAARRTAIAPGPQSPSSRDHADVSKTFDGVSSKAAINSVLNGARPERREPDPVNAPREARPASNSSRKSATDSGRRCRPKNTPAAIDSPRAELKSS